MHTLEPKLILNRYLEDVHFKDSPDNNVVTPIIRNNKKSMLIYSTTCNYLKIINMTESRAYFPEPMYSVQHLATLVKTFIMHRALMTFSANHTLVTRSLPCLNLVKC